MKRKKLTPVRLVSAIVLLLGSPQWVAAQGDDPFGTKPAAESASKVLPKFDPSKREDLVVLAVRESNPTTPEELAEAAELMLDYGQAAESKKYLTQLLSANPNPSVLAALQDKRGSAFFLRIIRDERLAPEGAQLGRAVLKAGYDLARDPERLRKLADQLSDPSPDLQRLAASDLLKAEEAAIAPLLSVLADRGRAEQHALAREILVRLGDRAVEPLIGAMESPDDFLRTQVVQVLGRLKSRQAMMHLFLPYLSSQSSAELRSAAERALLRIVGRTPLRHEAERLLLRRARSMMEGALPREPDYLDTIELWSWDAEQQASLPHKYSPQDASLVEARRVAGYLYQLSPNNSSYRRLYLMTLLESEKNFGGLNRPLAKGEGTAYEFAQAVGVGAIEDLLSHSLETDHIGAAIAAAEILGDLGDEELLYSISGRPRPLVHALSHGDRRVRFAAVEAILKIGPTGPFVGSNRVPETLGFFINTFGLPRALVGHPRREKVSTLAGMLNSLGFEADTATTGREAFLLAARSGDCEFVLISDAIESPRFSELIQLLRRDSRTSRLPIGLMVRSENMEHAQRLAQSDPLIEAFARPYDVDGMSNEVQLLIARIGRHRVLYDERIKQASAALDRLAYIIQHADEYPFYTTLAQQSVVEQALLVPELLPQAATALGLLATPLAQRALVKLASENARPLAQRRAAATAFNVAVKRGGLMLTTNEIQLQYTRYNRSATLDADTQAVLGDVLDTIEAPTLQANVGG